jgi:predicted amidohydrolase YtcJ
VAGVKLHADGIPTGHKTAWLHEPFQGGGNGVLVSGEGSDDQRVAEMEAMVRLAHDAGWQIGTDATTSFTPTWVLPATLKRTAALGIGANFNSTIKYLIADGNWRQGISTCVVRKGKQTGAVSGPEERISLDHAIWSHTAAGAWQDHAEDWKGTLETGKAADLCVLDGGITRVDPDHIGSLKVDLTVVDGKVVYQR